MRRHLVLVGMMGAGKSTVGREVASRLGVPFADSDESVEARAGRTVADLFESGGEDLFREVEREVLADLLASAQPCVLAAAGGSILDPATRAGIARCKVVWLRADPAVLERRVRAGGHRPLIEHDPASTLRRIAAEREHIYAGVADQVIDVDDLDLDEVVERVLEAAGETEGGVG